MTGVEVWLSDGTQRSPSTDLPSPLISRLPRHQAVHLDLSKLRNNFASLFSDLPVPACMPLHGLLVGRD